MLCQNKSNQNYYVIFQIRKPCSAEILLQFTIALVHAVSFQLAIKTLDGLNKQKYYKSIFKIIFIVLKIIAFLLVLFAQLCRFNLKLFTFENVHERDAGAS